MSFETPKAKITPLTILSYIMVILGTILFIWGLYQTLWPFKTIDIKSVQIETPTIHEGGTLIYKINSCKYTSDTPTVYKKIVSATSAQALPVVQGVVRPGCNITNVPVHIMGGTPPGKYTLDTEIIYNISPIRSIKIYWHAGPFEVVQ